MSPTMLALPALSVSLTIPVLGRVPRVVVCGAMHDMRLFWEHGGERAHAQISPLPYGDIGRERLVVSDHQLDEETCLVLDGADELIALNVADEVPPALGAAMRYATRMDIRQRTWLFSHHCHADCLCGDADARLWQPTTFAELGNRCAERSYWSPAEARTIRCALADLQSASFAQSAWACVAQAALQRTIAPWYVRAQWLTTIIEQFWLGRQPPSPIEARLTEALAGGQVEIILAAAHAWEWTPDDDLDRAVLMPLEYLDILTRVGDRQWRLTARGHQVAADLIGIPTLTNVVA